MLIILEYVVYASVSGPNSVHIEGYLLVLVFGHTSDSKHVYG